MLPTSNDQQDAWPDEPYKGLQYYSATDRRLFSGREADIEICVHRLTSPETRILLLHGYTGCGKSSFLRAGLIPSIESFGPGYCFLRDANDAPLFIRSGQDPLARIAEEIFRLASGPVLVRGSNKAVDISDVIAPYADVDAFVAECHEPFVLSEVLQAISKKVPATLVIVIDQAEEVITLDGGDHACKRHFFRFIRDFHAANFPIKLVIALRSEYSGLFVELGQDDGGVDLRSAVPSTLWQAGGSSNQSIVRSDIKLFLLRELDREEVKEAIVLPTSSAEEHGNPLAKYGFTYADDVPEEIVGDLFKTGTTAALPAMQLTCRDLYNHLPPDRKITRAQYIAAGRITGPVDRHISKSLRNAFGALGSGGLKGEEKRWREVLCSLVQGESGGAVRTRIMSMLQLKEIAERCGVAADFDTVVARLSEPNVLLLRSVPSGTQSKDGPALSLGHDFIGMVLHQWQATEKAAEEATDSAKKKIRKTRRRALWVCAGAFTFFGAVAAVFAYAEVLGSAKEKYDVLVNNALNQERTNYSASMLTAALAIGVADGHRPWIKDTEARAVLAQVLAGRPESVVTDQLKGEAAVGAGKAVTTFIPLKKSGDFVQIREGSVLIRGKKYHLPSNEKKSDPFWTSKEYVISESEHGSVLILVKELALTRDGKYERYDRLYAVSDTTKENLDSPFDLAYFLGLPNSLARESSATEDAEVFLGMNEGLVTLSMKQMHGATGSLWLRVFAFDEKNGAFSVVGSKLDRLPVSLEKSAGVPGSLVLGNYAVVSEVSEPSAGDEPNLVRYALFPGKAQRNPSVAGVPIPLPKNRNWQMVGSAHTAAGPVLFLAAPNASERYAENWTPRLGNFSDLLIVDVATLGMSPVETARIQEARKNCGVQPAPPAGSLFDRDMNSDPISFVSASETPLAVIGSGQAVDLVSMTGGSAACLGRLHFTNRIDRWVVARGGELLLGAAEGEGLGWGLRTTILEHATKLSGEPNLVDRACWSDLDAMIRNIAKEDWPRVSGVRKLPDKLTSGLCAGAAGQSANVSR